MLQLLKASQEAGAADRGLVDLNVRGVCRHFGILSIFAGSRHPLLSAVGGSSRLWAEYACCATYRQAKKCMACNTYVDAVVRMMHSLAMYSLTQHLTSHGLTQRAFAARIGVDPSIVSRLCANLMTPSLHLAIQIERETNGAVPASSWVDAEHKRAGAA